MSESKSTATRAKMVPDQEFIKAYVAVTKLAEIDEIEAELAS